MSFGIALGFEQQQLLEPLQKIVVRAPLLAHAQRHRGDRVGSGRPADAEIDAAGKQRLQDLEALGHHQRRVVGKHHAAGTHPQPPGFRRDLPDHDLGGGAGNRGEVVVLGKPIARIAEPVGKLGEVEAVAQRLRAG
jgi:hypothetical protein